MSARRTYRVEVRNTNGERLTFEVVNPKNADAARNHARRWALERWKMNGIIGVVFTARIIGTVIGSRAAEHVEDTSCAEPS